MKHDVFMIVNRDYQCLARSAIQYATRYHLTDQVARLYFSGSDEVVPHRRKGRKRTHKAEQQHIAVFDRATSALRAECLFIFPLKRGCFRVTSTFGPRKKSNGNWGFHYGLDMAAPRGTPVRTVAAGVVVEARFVAGFGNMVLVSHSNKLKTRYAHLSKIDVKIGDSVEQGQRIGRVGNTGNTRGRNGIHLHFEVLVYGKRINPLYLLP